MLDTFQFAGPFARYTLRAWSVNAGPEAQPAERVRYHDEAEAVAMLRGALDLEALRRLRVYLFEHGAMVSGLASASDSTLASQVARCIVSGELVLERQPIALMSSSEPIEFQQVVVYEAPVTTIDEGVGLSVRKRVDLPQPPDPAVLAFQAQQARVLRAASAGAVPFCEVCSQGPQTSTPDEAALARLAAQASQAQALARASADGTPFCERCSC